MSNLIRKEPKFTFVSFGTNYEFNTRKIVYDPMTKSRQNLLDIHRDLVRLADSPQVYILDHTGMVLSV